jgi:glycosyltransferase involved in cell wall biosynthesis
MTTKNIHVAFMVGSLRVGGAERMMVNTASELSRSVQVSFLSLTGGTELKHELNDDVKLYSFEKKNALSSIPSILNFIKKEKPEVLISTQIHVNLIAVILKIFFGIKTKIVLREATSPGSHFRMYNNFRFRMVSVAVKWLYPKADAIVAICEAVKTDLVESSGIPASMISVIYNPVINERFSKSLEEEVAHPFFEEGVPVFISVGRLAPAKNFSLLIQSFSLVLKKKDARLLIIGEGEERKNLEQQVSDLKLSEKISLPGVKVNPYPWMRKSNAYVLTSLYEGLPNALIEAMASGLQLISVDCPGGSREILEDGATGRLVNMNDPQALADTMLRVLESSVDKKVMLESAKRFEAGEIGKKYLSLITQLNR